MSGMNDTEKKFLTTNEICKMLGITHPTFYKLIKEGKLRAFNTGKKYLVEKEEIQKLIGK